MAKAREIPGLDGRMAFDALAREAVTVRAEEVFEHAEDVLNTDDIERVHAMRVATRRLRAVLEVFAPAFDPKDHKKVLKDVKQLADALGARRDPDVQLAALEAFAEGLEPADREGLDLLALVANSVEVPAGRTSTLLIKPGSAAGLRRRAGRSDGVSASADDLDPVGRHAGWDAVRMPFAHLWDTARMIAEQGPDVLVVEPPDLREAVIRLLVGARSSDGPALTGATGNAVRLSDEVARPITLDAPLVSKHE